MVTPTSVPNAVQEYFDRALLLRGTPALVHALFGRRGTLLPNSGNKVRWTRIESLASKHESPLEPGVNPDGTDWESTNIDATLEEYGDYAPTASIKEATEDSVVLNGIADAFGEQMGLTLDLVTREKIMGGTNVVYANNVATRDAVVSATVYGDLDRLIMALATGNARPITEFVGSAPDAVAEPIMPCFPTVVHPHCVPAIEAIQSTGAGFVPVRKYAANTVLLPGEFGSYGQLRLCSCTNAKVYTDAGGAKGSLRSTGGVKADVYTITAFGRESFGVSPLSNTSTVGMIIKTAEQVGGPLNRYSTVGWVAMYIAKILNDNFMARLEVGATA